MQKIMLLFVGLIVFLGCSREPAPINSVNDDSTDTTSTEFVPEHIQRSHIEVVPH